MKGLHCSAGIASMCLLAMLQTEGKALFVGTLITGKDSGFIAGSISLGISNSQALFQVTLHQYWLTGVTLAPVLETDGRRLPFSLGTGRPGRWPIQEFIRPTDEGGSSPVVNRDSVDGGFSLPLYKEGIRFRGTFNLPREMEQALRSKGGIMEIQVRGSVDAGGTTLHDPLLSAPLSDMTRHEFLADLRAVNPRSAQATPFGSAAFALTGRSLEPVINFFRRHLPA